MQKSGYLLHTETRPMKSWNCRYIWNCILKCKRYRYRRLKGVVSQGSTALILLYCKRYRPPLLYRCLAVTPTDGALWQQDGKRRPLCGKKFRTPKNVFHYCRWKTRTHFSCRQDLHRLLFIIFFLILNYGWRIQSLPPPPCFTPWKLPSQKGVFRN